MKKSRDSFRAQELWDSLSSLSGRKATLKGTELG